MGRSIWCMIIIFIYVQVYVHANFVFLSLYIECKDALHWRVILLGSDNVFSVGKRSVFIAFLIRMLFYLSYQALNPG